MAAVLAAIAWWSPPPDRVTDRQTYEITAERFVVPDCTDLHCFRVFVPWVLGAIPGPSDLKWKAYAVVANAAAALAVFRLCVLFGLSRRGAWLASTMSALGFGSLYTLHDPYTADPLMYVLGPVLMFELLRERVALAGVIAAVGVLGKEFAAAPLYLFSLHAALEARFSLALRALVAGNAAFIVWLVLQLTFIIGFNYGYGGTTSINLLSGGGVVPWFEQQSVRGAASAIFNEFGGVWALAPVGLFVAPAPLPRLALVAVPFAAIFGYVQQPDRAFWNFHFLVLPLAAAVLERVPAGLAWATVGAGAAANLRLGAQWPILSARYPLAIAVVLAVASIAVAARGREGRI